MAIVLRLSLSENNSLHGMKEILQHLLCIVLSDTNQMS